MTNTLTISRELAERLDSPHSSVRNAALESLRRIIAAPGVERQEPVLFVAVESIEDLECVGMHATRVLNDLQCVPLYTSPPAPVAVVLPERADSVAAERGYHKGWNACLDKVKELNK